MVALDLSYAMPIAVNCLRGRNCLPERAWRLPRGVGWVVDIVLLPVSLVCAMEWLTGMQIALAYIALTTVLFLFPPDRLVTGSNMSACPMSTGFPQANNTLDYCIVAFAIIMIISLLHWFIHGRRHFTGPQDMTPIDRDSIDHTQQELDMSAHDTELKQPPE